MTPLFCLGRQVLLDEDGVSAIEYALIAATIAVAVTATVFLVGEEVKSFYVRLKACIDQPQNC